MATVTKPIALNESFNTTEQTPRNLADVLAQALQMLNTTISGLNFINCVVVQALPTTDISTTTIYLVPKNPSQTDNLYDEYINLTGTSAGWEKIGDTEIDLSGYYTSAEVDDLLADKADTSDIPTVNDGTLTIQQNGETKGTFTANQSGNSTVNIEIPTTDIQTAVDEFETYNGGLLSECKVTLEPVQSGSGDPSPDNVRPISGHTQAEVDVSDGQTTQEQVTVNLGGTYYGGTVDLVSGVMTVDWAMDDMGNLDYSYNASAQLFYVNLIARSIGTNFISSHYSLGTDVNHLNDGEMQSGTGNKNIFFKNSAYTDVSVFKTAMSGVQLCYELATPQTIQLTPQQVKALVGENHLSAPLDGQEIDEVKYKKMFTFDDVIAYIQSLS